MNNSNNNRINKWVSTMHSKAGTSAIAQKHAAMVLHNGVPVSYGINTIRGARPYHAEANAVRSFLIARGLLGWVKECGILRGSKKTKGRQGT